MRRDRRKRFVTERDEAMSSRFSTGMASILIVLVFTLTVIGYLSYVYNSLTDSEEEVFTAWSQVESNYQRRADLIPNLVKTVRSFAEHEKTVIQNATDARSKNLSDMIQSAADLESTAQSAQKIAADGGKRLTDQTRLQEIDASQKQVKDKMAAFMAIAEAYPNLRAADNFLALQDQLEGTENRINVSRLTFNEKAGQFNASIRRIPGSFMASLGNFQRKAYFKAQEGAARPVAVEFNTPGNK